jgi:SAM-dependent methyltransferase
MVQRTQSRVESEGLGARVRIENVGGQDLHRLQGEAAYDGVYSNLGPLNCVPDLHEVSRECARLVRPGGKLVFTVVGRVCPWEIAHYMARGRWKRATVRLARGTVAVGMNNHTIWTQYYGPREFYRAFRGEFRLRSFRGVCVFAPPPYLTAFREKHPGGYARLWKLDRLSAGWPLLRGLGDHFLIVLERR